MKLSEHGDSCFSSMIGTPSPLKRQGSISPVKKINSISPVKKFTSISPVKSLRGGNISPINTVTPKSISPVKQGFSEILSKRLPTSMLKSSTVMPKNSKGINSVKHSMSKQPSIDPGSKSFSSRQAITPSNSKHATLQKAQSGDATGKSNAGASRQSKKQPRQKDYSKLKTLEVDDAENMSFGNGGGDQTPGSKPLRNLKKRGLIRGMSMVIGE